MINATIKDVALDASVSTATVSRVLNMDTKVSVETTQKVKRSIQKLEYSVNSVARSLKVKETKTVAVIAPELTNDFFILLFEQIEYELHKAGYTLLVCSSNNSIAEEKKRLAYLADRMVDGIVAIPNGGKHSSHYKALQARGIPLVFVDRNFSDVEADSILVDNEEASYSAVCALIRDGYVRIGFIGGDNTLTARERYYGYERAMNEHHLPIEDDFVLFCGMSTKNGFEGMDAFLRKSNYPEALFFVSLMIQVGAAQRIMQEPPEVQKKLYCAGFDDTFYLPLLSWCKYSVSQPVAQIGTLAAQMILDRIQNNGQDKVRFIRMKTQLLCHKNI